MKQQTTNDTLKRIIPQGLTSVAIQQLLEQLNKANDEQIIAINNTLLQQAKRRALTTNQ